MWSQIVTFKIMKNAIIPNEKQIIILRGLPVMLDSELAAMYQVPTSTLNQAVKRNKERFPPDFMFRLTKQEWENLKSQFVISSWGGRRKLPYAFTEQGVAMLSSVLKSPTAITVNIQIMRVFVRVRQLTLQQNKQIDISTLKQALLMHIKQTKQRFDHTQEQLNAIVDVINDMLESSQPKSPRKIGFK